MASYSTPAVSDIEDWSGINTAILGQDAADLEALLTSLIANAEAETQAQVGSGHFTSASLQAFQVTLLQESVARRTAARFLDSPAVRKLTGTNEPINSEESEAYEAKILGLLDRAKELGQLVISSIQAAGTPTAEMTSAHGFHDSDAKPFSTDGTEYW